MAVLPEALSLFLTLVPYPVQCQTIDTQTVASQFDAGMACGLQFVITHRQHAKSRYDDVSEPGAVDNPGNVRQHRRSETHGTGLAGGIQCAPGEVKPAQLMAGVNNRIRLGMRNDTPVHYDRIVCTGDYFSVFNDDCAER